MLLRLWVNSCMIQGWDTWSCKPCSKISQTHSKEMTFLSKGEILEVVNHVLKYLKFTPRRWLLFKKGGSLSMQACIDDDYAG